MPKPARCAVLLIYIVTRPLTLFFLLISALLFFEFPLFISAAVAELGITTSTAGTSVGVRVSVILPSASAIFAIRASTLNQTAQIAGRHAEIAPLVSTTWAAIIPLIVGKDALTAPRAGLAPEQDSLARGRVRSAPPVHTAPVAHPRNNARRVDTPVHPPRLVKIANRAR